MKQAIVGGWISSVDFCVRVMVMFVNVYVDTCLRITECLLICIKLICISSDKLWEKIIQRTCLVTLIHIIFNKQSKFRESQHISKYSYFKCLQMPNVFTGFIYNIFRKKV